MVTHIYLQVEQQQLLERGHAAIIKADKRNEEIIFKNSAPFIDCISEINNTQVDNAKDLGVVIPMYNLIKYSNNCPETSGNLWQYYRHEPASDNNGNIVSFPGNSALLNLRRE